MPFSGQAYHASSLTACRALLSVLLSEPDAVAHVGLMEQKHPAMICVGM